MNNPHTHTLTLLQNDFAFFPFANQFFIDDLGHVRMHLQDTDSVNIKQLCALE